MILWFKPRQEEFINFFFLDLRVSNEIGLKHLKFHNTGGVPYGISNFSLTLRSIWETVNNKFILIG
jgi:hypothetical protein